MSSEDTITTPVSRDNIERQFFQERLFAAIGVAEEKREGVTTLYAYETGGAKAATARATAEYAGDGIDGKATYRLSNVEQVNIPMKPIQHFYFGTPEDRPLQ